LFLPGPIHRVLAQSLLFKTRGAGEGSLPSLHSPPVARARTNRKRPAKNEDLVRLQVADAPPAPGWRIRTSRSMQRCDGCAGRRRSRSTQRHLAAGVKKERARDDEGEEEKREEEEQRTSRARGLPTLRTGPGPSAGRRARGVCERPARAGGAAGRRPSLALAAAGGQAGAEDAEDPTRPACRDMPYRIW
ncbi:unnamed protein product, partial [Prorocentrum cordatum]